MKRKLQRIVVLLVILAFAIVGFVFFINGTSDDSSAVAAEPSRVSLRRPSVPVCRHEHRTTPKSATKCPRPSESPADPALDAAEKAAAAFDDFVEKWETPRPEGATAADAEAFHAAFCRLPAERRDEEICWALNLIPDDNLLLVVGVLMDKQQPKEVLDSLFNDILNRDEARKKVLIEKIHADKAHPCWKDADWVIEATAE